MLITLSEIQTETEKFIVFISKWVTGWIFHFIQSHDLQLKIECASVSTNYKTFINISSVCKDCDLIKIEVSFLLRWKRNDVYDKEVLTNLWNIKVVWFLEKFFFFFITINNIINQLFNPLTNIEIFVAPIMQFNAIHSAKKWTLKCMIDIFCLNGMYINIYFEMYTCTVRDLLKIYKQCCISACAKTIAIFHLSNGRFNIKFSKIGK